MKLSVSFLAVVLVAAVSSTVYAESHTESTMSDGKINYVTAMYGYKRPVSINYFTLTATGKYSPMIAVIAGREVAPNILVEGELSTIDLKFDAMIDSSCHIHIDTTRLGVNVHRVFPIGDKSDVTLGGGTGFTKHSAINPCLFRLLVRNAPATRIPIPTGNTLDKWDVHLQALLGWHYRFNDQSSLSVRYAFTRVFTRGRLHEFDTHGYLVGYRHNF